MKAILLAGAALIASGSANAQTAGAPMGASTQAGSWGSNGWQTGAPATMPNPATAAPAMTAPMHPHMDFPHMDQGRHVPKPYRQPRYAVNDWQDWGFGQPAMGTHWVRYYDDALLIDAGGTVINARYGVNWDGPRHPHGYGYAGYPGNAGVGYGSYLPCTMPGTTVSHPAPGTTVTTHMVGAGCGAYQGGGIIVVPATVTTTTVVTERRYRTWSHHRAWHRPIRSKLVRRPCNCGS